MVVTMIQTLPVVNSIALFVIAVIGSFGVE